MPELTDYDETLVATSILVMLARLPANRRAAVLLFVVDKFQEDPESADRAKAAYDAVRAKQVERRFQEELEEATEAAAKEL